VTDPKLAPQYKAAADAIRDFMEGYRNNIGDTVQGCAALIALSNLAVAESIHLLTERLHTVPVVNTTGSLILDHKAVAAAIDAQLARRDRKDPDA
jgi:hypothetical protein